MNSYWLWLLLSAWTMTVVQAQPPTRAQLAGTWIGIRLDYDEPFHRPNPLCMVLGTDSTYSLSLIDADSPVRRATWSVRGQEVRLDTALYSLSQWTLAANELRLTGAYPMTFRRLTESVVDLNAVREALSGHTWATDSISCQFRPDGAVYVENLQTGDVGVHCWRLAPVGQSVFLVIKGNQNDCQGNFQYPLQVTRLLAGEIACLGGGWRANDRLLFRRGAGMAGGSPKKPSGFQPCRTYIFAPANLYPYYTYRRGRLFDIRQVVAQEYRPVTLPGQSGLIRFRFVVNCRGQAGQFDVLEVNENYQKFSFDSRISEQLNTICRSKLPDWDPGTTNDTNEAVDTVCLLTFRLKDGLITEIFP